MNSRERAISNAELKAMIRAGVDPDYVQDMAEGRDDTFQDMSWDALPEEIEEVGSNIIRYEVVSDPRKSHQEVKLNNNGDRLHKTHPRESRIAHVVNDRTNEDQWPTVTELAEDPRNNIASIRAFSRKQFLATDEDGEYLETGNKHDYLNAQRRGPSTRRARGSNPIDETDIIKAG